ncbi:MAG: phosphoenolpyruvate--protein phosphotransferase [Polyangiaceae bacterium]|jgi:phosphotransferase system enzyme I (PtsI)|nr:phosphoenolpyruvate--protein phosphotransferase [Polyangiaceae bacterium]
MSAQPDAVVLHGISGSPGIAIGAAFVLGDQLARVPRRTVSEAERPTEIERFRAATARAKEELRRLVASTPERSTATAVLEAYALMAEDPMLGDGVLHRIRAEGRCAEWAVALTVQHFASQLGEADDPYLRERSRDVEFVGQHLLRAFDGAAVSRKIPPGQIILVAQDLSPADAAGFVFVTGPERAPSSVVAFVTEVGTRTSHTSITARALKLPAVVGVNELCEAVDTGDLLIVDGLRGVVIVRPTEEDLEEARQRAGRHRALASQLHESRELRAQTQDGVTLAVRANVEIPEEAREASAEGAEGIGLYRTEYLYIDRVHPPTEEEQLVAFRAVLEAMPADAPVVLRTFDIGGDKFASTFKMPIELNPMLGLRAVRLALLRPEVFLEHLRAMVRASAFGDVRIMVPMVSSVGELKWVRQMLDKAIEQVKSSGGRVAEHIPLGVMIEVPSAAVLADHFARHAEFMSIGTNDLIQYTLAVDRSSRRLAYLASPFDPSILRLIERVVSAGARFDCPVSVCGAMAGDPLSALLLLGLGVREFSMEVSAIPEIRETFRRVTLEEAERVAERALELDSADDIERVVAEAFAIRLHDLISGAA